MPDDTEVCSSTNNNYPTFVWPSRQGSQWSFEQRLQGTLDLNHPGMREWSFDHHVITLGLVPKAASEAFRRFPDFIGTFMRAIGVPFDRPSSPSGMVPSDVEVVNEEEYSIQPHPDVTGARALAVLVSQAIAVSEPLEIELAFGSRCKPFWEKIMLWFCDTPSSRFAETPTSTSCIYHSTPLATQYPRLKELDTVLDAQAALSAAGSEDAQEELLFSDWLRRVAHARLWDILPDWTYIASNTMLSYTRRKGSNRLPYQIDEDYENLVELHEATKHSKMVDKFISERVSPFMEDPKYVEDVTEREQWTEELRERILHYPVAGTVDSALSVPTGHFFQDVRSVLGEDVALNSLMETITLFHHVSNPNLATPQFGWSYSATPSTRYACQEAPTKVTDSDMLHLPMLLLCFQDMGAALKDSTRNRVRLACVSAVRFLAVLGVTDFPVYGLCVCGPYGIPCIAWYSSENECCYIIDRNTAYYRFDLTQEEGVLRYIAFLSKVEERGRELRERFEQAKPSLLEKMQTEEGRAGLRWTARAQLDDYQLWADEVAEDDEEKPRDVMEAIEEYVRAGGLASFKRK
ncbi:hypothetical protein C8Q78DRAFT_557631 [Trametes maxima]|nr:hypothetical protein C8Q78DRAFT_557631 [Trametes maxima]